MLSKISFYLLSILLLSCTKLDSSDSSALEDDGLVPRMKPSKVEYPTIDDNYIATKSASIERFCEKYWSNENNNLVFWWPRMVKSFTSAIKVSATANKTLPSLSDTPLHIASVSKVITASAILLLVNHDKIRFGSESEYDFRQLSLSRNYRSYLVESPQWIAQLCLFYRRQRVWDQS
jgi:hypothetical protein